MDENSELHDINWLSRRIGRPVSTIRYLLLKYKGYGIDGPVPPPLPGGRLFWTERIVAEWLARAEACVLAGEPARWEMGGAPPPSPPGTRPRGRPRSVPVGIGVVP